MDESIKEIGDHIIASQLVVDKVEILQLVQMQRSAWALPLDLDDLGGDAPKPHAPALQQHDLHLGLALLVHGDPLLAGPAVPKPGEGALVVLRDEGGLAAAQRREDVAQEGDIVGARLAADLDQGIIRVGGSQSELVLMTQVEVIDGDDESLQALALLEGLGQGADEGSLADALDAVEAYDEGAGGLGCAASFLLLLLGLVGFEPLKDWVVLASSTKTGDANLVLLKGMHLGDLSSMMRDWRGTSGVLAMACRQETDRSQCWIALLCYDGRNYIQMEQYK